MGSKDMTGAMILTILVVMQLLGFGSADLEKDRDQCMNQLLILGPCLTYVEGAAKAPTLDCCSGLKQVLQKSKICLCILVKDRDDPGLGIKINATLALGLPDRCNEPSNANECPSLLQLAPGSPDAKIFEDYAKNNKGSISTPTGKENGTSDGSTSAAVKNNNGGMEKKGTGIEMAFGIVFFVFLLSFPFSV